MGSLGAESAVFPDSFRSHGGVQTTRYSADNKKIATQPIDFFSPAAHTRDERSRLTVPALLSSERS